MITFNGEGVNELYNDAIWYMYRQSATQESRNGKVKVAPTPVTSIYHDPRQRILFDRQRNANPFFHVVEAMWMLAGRNDVKTVVQLAKQMAEYSDDGITLHGAYGYRWRNHFGEDQIKWVVKELKRNPLSRRCHIAMWDPQVDVPKVEEDGKDVPCNTGIDFMPRPGGYLDMIVSNRSNDIIWGCYGANAVHMSFLHEFVALASGLKMGKYYQVSANWHMYHHHFDLLEYPKGEIHHHYLEWDKWVHTPLLANKPDDAGWFLAGLNDVFLDFNNKTLHVGIKFDHHYIDNVLVPLLISWQCYKKGDMESAISYAGGIADSAIRLACHNWLKMRIE
jgi:thymidylate synthase